METREKNKILEVKATDISLDARVMEMSKRKTMPNQVPGSSC
jgi:hypothetical protein